ncbi:hypothetical protein ENSA5_45950 [Enhygromyxa salina]|uniref:Uncharacterized protein n=1 Tax=Enhygromyxa salina TaxID=215803 RepID=A0A2S9XJI8_9BACT|nr:hypothetical protein [Enhygromyxa salina]PRP93034.1 hypothetical protein ENSA5_45950 [Enhygromyxa salina]
MTPSAMGDERRWAARYQFLEQLWRGRDRIVCDPEIEAVLHAGIEGPLAGLLSDLIPAEGGDARAWVALHNARRAASFARDRSGTVFVDLDDAAELASDEGWQVALVNLSSLAKPSRDELAAFIEILGERAEDDASRSVILTLACGDDEDACYEELAEIVDEVFSDGRIYGLTRPGMVAFYDFGPVLELEGDGAEGDAPDEVGIEVDNSLGSEAPAFEAFVAVVGATLPSEGVTFVELPARAGARERTAAGPGATRAESEELAAARAQLAEAQRRGDMQAIERQALLEQLEQAEDRIAKLDDELESLREQGGGPGGPAASEGPRLDEALAREQALRWELDRVRGELENLRVRPVETLEAEVASLRARLAQAEAELAEADFDEAEDVDELEGELRGDLDEAALSELTRLLADDDATPAQAREWMKARAKLEHLLRKLERGGRLSALELHRELSSLRRLL